MHCTNRQPQDCEGGALPAAFEQAALLHHARPALGAGRWQPTYGELNAAANRLAHALLRRSGTSEGQAAILMQHDTPAIAAVLAVLKAGKIAAALNPTYPPARLRQLIEDIEPALIITDIVHLDLASEIAGPACAVIRFEDESGQGPDHNPSLVIGADQTACLVYTSRCLVCGLESAAASVGSEENANGARAFGDLKLTWNDRNWHPMRPGIMVRFDEIQERDGCLSVSDARVHSTGLMREFVNCLDDFLRAADLTQAYGSSLKPMAPATDSASEASECDPLVGNARTVWPPLT
jgi:hypothetical protein